MTIPSSEVMFEPWKDHEMASGWSPFLTMQDTCAKSPSLRISPPNERGESSGCSVDEKSYKTIKFYEKLKKGVGNSESCKLCACSLKIVSDSETYTTARLSEGLVAKCIVCTFLSTYSS